MQWKRLGIAAALISLAGGFYFAYCQELRSDNSHEELEMALRSQNEILQKSTEKALKNADHFMQDFLSRWKKHDASYELLLQLSGAPQQILYDTKRFRSKELDADPVLYQSMERFLGSKETYSIYTKDGKFFLLLRGEFKNKNYVAAYERDAFFHFLGSSSAFRNWVVTGAGIVIYHPSPRYMGSDIANYKPVAAGLFALQEKNLKEVYTTNAGLDGLETQLVWSSAPASQLIFGSEWAQRGAVVKNSEHPSLLVVSFLLLALGAFLLGFSFVKKSGVDAEVGTYEFDQEKLDQELILAQENARKYLAQSHDKQMLLDLWNEIFILALSASTVKQVWMEITSLLAEKLPGTQVIFYRYSNTSYALVPETVAGVGDLEENARAYLSDARIFLGAFSPINTVKESQAFRGWNQLRNRHMPLANDEEFFVFLDANTASRGAYLILADKDIASQDWFLEKMNCMQDFVYRVSLLCELKQRLLQSKNVKSSARETLASTPNNA